MVAVLTSFALAVADTEMAGRREGQAGWPWEYRGVLLSLETVAAGWQQVVLGADID